MTHGKTVTIIRTKNISVSRACCRSPALRRQKLEQPCLAFVDQSAWRELQVLWEPVPNIKVESSWGRHLTLMCGLYAHAHTVYTHASQRTHPTNPLPNFFPFHSVLSCQPILVLPWISVLLPQMFSFSRILCRWTRTVYFCLTSLIQHNYFETVLLGHSVLLHTLNSLFHLLLNSFIIPGRTCGVTRHTTPQGTSQHKTHHTTVYTVPWDIPNPITYHTTGHATPRDTPPCLLTHWWMYWWLFHCCDHCLTKQEQKSLFQHRSWRDTVCHGSEGMGAGAWAAGCVAWQSGSRDEFIQSRSQAHGLMSPTFRVAFFLLS